MSEENADRITAEEQARAFAERIARYYLDRGWNLHLPTRWYFGMNTKKTQHSEGHFEKLVVSVEREHEHKARIAKEEADIERIRFLESEVHRMKILIGEVAIQNLPNRGSIKI